MQKIWASVLTLCALVSVFAVLALGRRTPTVTATTTPVVVLKSGTGKSSSQSIQTVANTTAPQATTATS